MDQDDKVYMPKPGFFPVSPSSGYFDVSEYLRAWAEWHMGQCNQYMEAANYLDRLNEDPDFRDRIQAAEELIHEDEDAAVVHQGVGQVLAKASSPGGRSVMHGFDGASVQTHSNIEPNIEHGHDTN